MTNIIPYEYSAIKVKNENDLPYHVTFEQFKMVYKELVGLDKLLWGLLWETGGRITAVLSIRWADINFIQKEMRLLVQKKKLPTTIKIPLSDDVISDLKNYIAFVKPDIEDYVFKTDLYHRMKSSIGRLTRQGAYNKIKSWGKAYLSINIHPHMLRHGLAIYLLSKNVPIPIISARLGHSNIFITQKNYLVITSDLQRQMTAHVPMR